MREIDRLAEMLGQMEQDIRKWFKKLLKKLRLKK
jgi:hypothetical protein